MAIANRTEEPIPLVLVADVLEVLERHGYQRPTGTRARQKATADVCAAVVALVAAVQGGAQ